MITKALVRIRATDTISKYMKLESGTTISHYKILSKIGEGGMGEVYLAQDTKLDRKVALKILPQEFAEDADRMGRFVQEAKAASALNHPNIITIHEIGETNGTHFIATEFIDGKTLNDYAKAERLKFSSTLDIALQVASALDEAHMAGIVHRDIKPDNIMVRSNGLVKILDFGIAKLAEKQNPAIDSEDKTAVHVSTTPGMIIGTANYMSPEQAKGKEVDTRTDIFSMGVVIYEMIAGYLPFDGESPLEIIGSILNKEPKPITGSIVPQEIERLISKTLRKDRDERYQTIKGLLADLKEIKQELEFQNKLDKTIQPNRDEPKTQMIESTTVDELEQTTTAKNINNSISIKKSSFSKILAGVIAILFISLIGLGYWYFTSNNKQIGSIAVMPFVNESGNKDIEYLSDGMTETLINSLSQLPDISVKARSSVFRYKGIEFDAKKIAAELDVEAILTGRIVQRGEQITLNLELIDPNTETTIWGNKYERKSSELVSLQTEIARDVSGKLKPKLSGEDEQKLTKEYTTNPKAFEAYLKGRFYWGKRTGDSLKQGVTFFNQAIELDPNYALAWSGLADSYIVLYWYTSIPWKEVHPKARAAAEKAVALDPELAEARTSLASSLYERWDITGAEKEFKAAIKLNPKYATAHHWYGGLLVDKGDLEGALRETRKATELEPFSVVMSEQVGELLRYLGRDSEAIAQYRKTLEMDGNFSWTHLYLGYVLAKLGKYDEALDEMKKAAAQNPSRFTLGIGYVYALSGETQKAREILRQELDRRKRNKVFGGEIAAVYIALGEKEKAIESLEEGFGAQPTSLQWVKADPVFASLLDEPRFQALMKKIGLPE